MHNKHTFNMSDARDTYLATHTHTRNEHKLYMYNTRANYDAAAHCLQLDTPDGSQNDLRQQDGQCFLDPVNSEAPGHRVGARSDG